MEAAPDCFDLSRNELAAEIVRSAGELLLRVTGSSMLPAIWPGDVLLIRHCSVQAAGVGDVILFTRHRRLFAHRVISHSGGSLVTQGDATPAPDPSVSASEFLGQVIHVWRRGKSVATRPAVTVSGRMTAMFLRRSATVPRLLTRLNGWKNRAGL